LCYGFNQTGPLFFQPHISGAAPWLTMGPCSYRAHFPAGEEQMRIETTEATTAIPIPATVPAPLAKATDSGANK